MGQFIGVRVGLRNCAAVAACQHAGTRDLPKQNEGTLCKINLREWGMCCHGGLILHTPHPLGKPKLKS